MTGTPGADQDAPSRTAPLLDLHGAHDKGVDDWHAAPCPHCQHLRHAHERAHPHRCPRCRKPYASPVTRPWRPNAFPASARMQHGLAAGLVLFLAGLSVYRELIYIIIPLGRNSGIWITLVGAPSWIAAAACVLAAVSVGLLVLDHYDRRDNERLYQHGRRYSAIGAVLLIVAALVVGALQECPADLTACSSFKLGAR